MRNQVLPGFRDFYPAEAAFRNHIFAAWREVARRYGFEEYDGPPLEPLDLYVKKSGEEIVGQLYAFEDKGGRQVALRPEMTPTLGRMVAARANALKKPIRWFSMPQLMRYERPQRGRLREHFQLNMDIIGESGPLADAELIAAALDVMRTLGLGPKEVRVKVSDRRVVRSLLDVHGLDEDQIAAAFQVIDKIDRDPRDVLAHRFMTSTGVTDDVAQHVLSIGDLKGRDSVAVALREVPGGPEAGEGLAECVEALEEMGLSEFVEVDLSIVRGLAYYTGVVFELFDTARSLRAICGGGRYDGLLASLGGPDLPAAGFGMGDVVLGELLKEHDAGPPDQGRLDAFLIAVTIEEVPQVLNLAHRLRDAGVRVEFGLKQQSIAKQLKLAAARPASRAVIIGPDERASGQAVVRDMAGGVEEKVEIDALVSDYDWS